MTLLLASLVLLVQAIPGIGSTATVTGTLKNAEGKPVPGVRVGALAQPDSPNDAVSAASIVSLAETDEAGRFKLEGIPAGRYYISAGRVDLPTYYPGTLYLNDGTVLTVTAGAAITNIDFTLQANSAGRASSGPALAPAGIAIPLVVQVEGGGKVPVFSSGGYAMLQLTRADGSRVVALLGASEIFVPAPAQDFDASVQFLPPGYVVKSIMLGSTDVTGMPVRIFGNAPASALTITLSRGSMPAAGQGVRVTGRIKGSIAQPRWIYISDIPGTLFSDGSFEFLGVPPGRHSVVTLDNPVNGAAYAASILVGRQDLNGVVLPAVAVLPQDVRASAAADSANTAPEGKVLPLAVLRGRVSKEGQKENVPDGSVFLVGLSWSSHRITANGTFEIPGLLPGRYDLEIQALGYPTVRRSITVGDSDLALDLSDSFNEP